MKDSMFDYLYNIAMKLMIVVYAAFAYIDINIDVVKVLFYLMLIDTFSGSAKAIILGHTYKFKLLLIGIVSKITILLIPITLGLMGKGMHYDFKWFIDLVIDLLIVSEGISIITNLIQIRTKKELDNYDFVTKVLKAIRKGLIKLFNGFIKGIDRDENKNEYEPIESFLRREGQKK